MRSNHSPNLVDWVATSLRWLFLLGFSISLSIEGKLTLAAQITLLVAAAWNLSLTFLAAFERRMPGQRHLSVAGDAVIAILLYYFSGMLEGELLWVGLLPITSAGEYFLRRGALLAALAFWCIQGFLTLSQADPSTSALELAPFAIIYLLWGLLIGWLGWGMRLELTRAQERLLSAQKQAERLERERSHALYKLISALGATLNYQRVLDTALDLGYTTLATTNGDSERMVCAVLLFADNGSARTELKVAASRRLLAADRRMLLPGTQGLIGRAIDEGVAQLGKAVPKDPELSRLVALRSCQSAYCIPLRMGLETYGVLLFAHPEEGYFTPERCEILDIIGRQAVIAMQNARLYRDLEQEKERIMEVQEEARKKLARDLHDGPTQSVAALAMRVNFARRLMSKDAAAAADELYKVEELARRTTKEIRHMLFTLRPLVLETQGLVAALESMAEKMKDTYNQTVVIDADEQVVSQLEMGRQGVIFYIAEEAVNNARKHAQAAHVWVRLKSAGEDMALLEIEDDGVGFDAQVVEEGYESRGSLGIVNMRERAELVNGILTLDTSPGRGTRVRVLIPLTEEAADQLHRGR